MIIRLRMDLHGFIIMSNNVHIEHNSFMVNVKYIDSAALKIHRGISHICRFVDPYVPLKMSWESLLFCILVVLYFMWLICWSFTSLGESTAPTGKTWFAVLVSVAGRHMLCQKPYCGVSEAVLCPLSALWTLPLFSVSAEIDTDNLVLVTHLFTKRRLQDLTVFQNSLQKTNKWGAANERSSCLLIQSVCVFVHVKKHTADGDDRTGALLCSLKCSEYELITQYGKKTSHMNWENVFFTIVTHSKTKILWQQLNKFSECECMCVER